ncbi:MAG: biotin/lipoyl-binding protein [Phyllobacteriaceae bacterium]|nr:biotin/lipoyl-binding protein [Phyllobacteriaceae bacterium]
MRSKTILLTGLCLTALVLGSAAFVARDTVMSRLLAPPAAAPDGNQRPAQPVQVMQVAFAATEQAVSHTGVVRPRGKRASGFGLPANWFHAVWNVGDAVTKGQVLAQIDPTDFHLAQLQAAEAELAAATVDHERALARH